MNQGKTKLIAITIGAIILTIIALVFISHKYQTVVVSVPKFEHLTMSNQPATSSPLHSAFLIPHSALLNVPFTPQAPTANWDQLHNEACEEAAAIMAAQYFASSTAIILPPELVEGEISKLTAWQDKTFGYHLDTTSAETAQMISEVYNLQTKLLENFTADDVKKELSQNRLVLISENGRLLGNPYYKQPGPIHHMLLIKGFDGDNFITNDSGTKNGRNYIYSFDTVFKAAADWNHAINSVDNSKKIAIILWK